MTEPTTPASGTGRGVRTPWSVLRRTLDALTVRRAFGEPIRQGEVTLVPVARVSGGSGAGYGGGEGDGDAPGGGSGGGSGFGLRVTPVGVYVVQGSTVRWEPAFDLTRVALVGSAVGAVTATAVACALRRRCRRR